MRKLYQSRRYKLHSIKRSKKSLRRRLLVTRLAKVKRRMMQGISNLEQKAALAEADKYRGYENISAPKTLSLLNNIEQTIGFINRIDRAFKKRRSVLIKLENVKEIDYAAIAVLLSVMIRFKHNKINFDGTLPSNDEARKKLVESTFFERLEKPFALRSNYTIKRDNQLFTRGSDIAEPELGLDLISAASETIWGEKRKSPGFQRVLLELMQNTEEHAAPNQDQKEFWWLSVNHNRDSKKVSFVFVDYGQGIFESLASAKPMDDKWYDVLNKIQKALGNVTNAVLLKKLLNGDVHRTVTKKSFRGKGLPGIKDVMERNQISSLKIISNDAFGDVEKDLFITLSNTFHGTFIYWELCYSNHNLIWNI